MNICPICANPIEIDLDGRIKPHTDGKILSASQTLRDCRASKSTFSCWDEDGEYKTAPIIAFPVPGTCSHWKCLCGAETAYTDPKAYKMENPTCWHCKRTKKDVADYLREAEEHEK